MFKKIINLLLICIFLLNAGLLYSSEALSLDVLIEEARKNNPDILAAKKRWQASLARIPQAKSPDDPTLGVAFEKIPRGTLKLDKTMPEDRKFSITQMFPFLGKLPLKGKIALVESQMAASEYKGKELEIINAIKKAYYDLFMNYKDIELSQDSLKLLEAIAKIAEAKYAVGKIPQEDLFKLNLEIAELSNKIQNLKQEQEAKDTLLNTLLNRQPESPLNAPEIAEDITFDTDINLLYKLTITNSPELIIFSYAIEKNKYAKSLAKRSFFPDIMAGVVQRGITSGTIGPWDLMLAFSVPLWFWTKQRYEVKEAIANLEEAQAAYQAMKNKSLSETKDLYTKIEIAKNKVKLAQNNLVPLLEASINSSLAAFRSGKGDLMMFLDSVRMLIETKMNYYQDLVEYNMNLADLERLVGMDLKEVENENKK